MLVCDGDDGCGGDDDDEGGGGGDGDVGGDGDDGGDDDNIVNDGIIDECRCSYGPMWLRTTTSRMYVSHTNIIICASTLYLSIQTHKKVCGSAYAHHQHQWIS